MATAKPPGTWSFADLRFEEEPPLKVHEGTISFDAGDGQGVRVQYGGRTPQEEMSHLLGSEDEAYAEVLREVGLPPETPDYPRATTDEQREETLQKICADDIQLWDGFARKVVPAVSKGFPGNSKLHIASMPGSDGHVYNSIVFLCLEEAISFGIVWEGNWGGIWFRVWRSLQIRAHADGKELLVLTKEDGSIGFNQSIEIAFMEKEGLAFKCMRGRALLEQLRPLVTAAGCGDIPRARALLERKDAPALVRQRSYSGKQSLHLLAMAGAPEAAACVRRALEHGADLEARSFLGGTPLHVAAQYGCPDALGVLLAARAQVNVAKKNGATPLFTAAQGGQVEAARLLLEAGAQADAANENGATPLFMSAQNGHLEAARALLGARARVDAARKDGRVPLDAARREGHADIVRLLQDAEAAA